MCFCQGKQSSCPSFPVWREGNVQTWLCRHSCSYSLHRAEWSICHLELTMLKGFCLNVEKLGRLQNSVPWLCFSAVQVLSGCTKDNVVCSRPKSDGYKLAEKLPPRCKHFDKRPDLNCLIHWRRALQGRFHLRGTRGEKLSLTCFTNNIANMFTACFFLLEPTTNQRSKLRWVKTYFEDVWCVSFARLTRSLFDVSAECQPGYSGTAAAIPCSATGHRETANYELMRIGEE